MIIFIIVLLIILALCSFLEVSFSGLNVIRIKRMAEAKDKRAKLVYDLYGKYSETVTTILVINCVTSVLVSSITTYYFSNLLGDSYVGIVTIVLTLVILIFTEIIPKIIGREYSEFFALKFASLLKFLVLIFTPISKVTLSFEKKIKNEHKVTATKDELVEIVKTIKDEGVIEEKESIFIQKAVILKKLKVHNIMIDKDNVSYLYDTANSNKVKESVFRDNHARIPVINKDNKAVGILYEVDLLDELLNNGTISVKKAMMEPICVNRNTNLASCLEVLSNARVHMALVTDKDNNFLGIVTMEDIISELMKS